LVGKKTPSLEIDEAPQNARRKLNLLNLGVGFLVSVGLGFLAFRGVDWSALGTQLRGAQPGYLLAAVVVGAIAALLKAIRWGVLLGPNPHIRLKTLFTTMMIGYLANNFLPARAGELVRIHLLHRKTGVSRATGFATVIVERLTDALFLLCLVAAVSFVAPIPESIRQSILIVAIALVLLTLTLLAFSRNGELPLGRIISLIERIAPRPGSRLSHVPARFVAGLGVLRSGGKSGTVLLLTISIWFTEGIPVLLTMRSLRIGLSFPAALFLLAVISLLSIIPAAPGAAGSYEFFAVLGLAPYAITGNRALGLALVLHGVNYLTVGILGLASLWNDGLKPNRFRGNKSEHSTQGPNLEDRRLDCSQNSQTLRPQMAVNVT